MDWHVYGSGLDEPLTMERGGQMYTYHRDALGSVTEITDATGELVERYAYDVYGTPQFFDSNNVPLTASAIGNPFLFTGRYYDAESGNYDYRARMYSPGLGRFLQTDPLGYVDGLNRYAYVGNNPATWGDPLGLLPNKNQVASFEDWVAWVVCAESNLDQRVAVHPELSMEELRHKLLKTLANKVLSDPNNRTRPNPRYLYNEEFGGSEDISHYLDAAHFFISLMLPIIA